MQWHPRIPENSNTDADKYPLNNRFGCWEAESRWKRSQLMSLSFCGERDLYLHAGGKRVENSRLCTSDSRTISQINNLYSTYAPVWNQASHTDKVVCRAVHANFRSPPIKLFFSFFLKFRGILKGSEQTCKKGVHLHAFVKTTCNTANRKIKADISLYIG